eukprot:3283733-Amphidinium_carterae.1
MEHVESSARYGLQKIEVRKVATARGEFNIGEETGSYDTGLRLGREMLAILTCFEGSFSPQDMIAQVNGQMIASWRQTANDTLVGKLGFASACLVAVLTLPSCHLT